MKTTQQLKEKCAELLNSRTYGDYGYSYPNPKYPVCVIYFGGKSAVYHELISEKLLRGWGGAAEQIPYYILEMSEKGSNNFGLKSIDGGNIDDRAFGADMTDLLSRSNIYAKASEISLYCVLNTDSVNNDSNDNLKDDLKEDGGNNFREWYSAIDKIRAMINTPMTAMLLIALNDEFNHQKKSVCIKQTLCQIYQSRNNTHLYESVFIIGRRFRNGCFQADGFGSCGDLFGNIILLSNTSDEGKDGHEEFQGRDIRRENLYKSAQPALTVAYSCSAKPVGDIAIITLKAITAKLSEMLRTGGFSTGNSDETARIAEILEVENGQSELYERIFARISGYLPSNDYLELLPGKPDLSKNYATADKASYGCLTAFLESNHFLIIQRQIESLKDEIIEQLSARICDELTAAELYERFPENALTVALDKARVLLNAVNYSDCSAIDAVKVKLKSGVSQAVDGIVRDTFRNLCVNAKICADSFFCIKESVDMMPAIREIGTGMHLAEFYTDKANRFLNAENCAKIFRSVFAVNNKETDVLNALFSAVKDCFESDPVYRHSYMDEMHERLGINDIHIATSQIIGELIDNLDEKVRFYSATVFPCNRTFEAYFLNTATSRANSAAGLNSENGLYERIKKRELPPNTARTFYNTQSNDIIESMWFYECRENDLSADM